MGTMISVPALSREMALSDSRDSVNLLWATRSCEYEVVRNLFPTGVHRQRNKLLLR